MSLIRKLYKLFKLCKVLALAKTVMFSVISLLFCWQIVDELREQILRLRFPHRVQNKEATPKTKRKNLGNASPSKSPPLPVPKPALSDRPCVVIFNKPLEKLLIRSAVDLSHSHSEDIFSSGKHLQTMKL